MTMHILIATDAWHPQINGVVRTLSALRDALTTSGARVSLLTPEGFATLPLPTYPDIRLALASVAAVGRRIEAVNPDAIHIATEGPIGHAVRRYCLRRRLPFTTSFTTRFPEYASARMPVPLSWGYAVLRRFHAPASAMMVSTPTLQRELEARGFRNIALWGRGVDTDRFRPEARIDLDLPRPIFVSVGRLAVEKNLDAFLSLDLPGSKLVIGDGPQAAELRARHPKAVFTGTLTGEPLAAHLAAADVFVFPSRTDTFGIVQLEALASGVPVAAYPVVGPADVIGTAPVGRLDDDLRAACLGALEMSRDACRRHALNFSWAASAQQFLTNLAPLPASAASPAPLHSAVGALVPHRAGGS
jgi:glycosyltransferase involved in cell wall biosynthesis